MGETPRQDSQGVESIGSLHHIEHAVALGDIAKDQHDANALSAACVDRRRAVGDRVLGAVPRNEDRVILELEGTVGGENHVHQVGVRSAGLLVDRAEADTQKLSRGLRLRPPREALGHGVEKDDTPLDIGGDDAVADAPQGHCQAVLLRSELLRPLSHPALQLLLVLCVDRSLPALLENHHDHETQVLHVGLVGRKGGSVVELQHKRPVGSIGYLQGQYELVVALGGWQVVGRCSSRVAARAHSGKILQAARHEAQDRRRIRQIPDHALHEHDPGQRFRRQRPRWREHQARYSSGGTKNGLWTMAPRTTIIGCTLSTSMIVAPSKARASYWQTVVTG